MALHIKKLSVGPYDNNAYLLRCTDTDEQLLIDAAAEPDRLLEWIGPLGLTTVVTTHRHGDHWQALEEVVAATGARSIAHPIDAPHIPGAVGIDGPVTVGNLELEVTHLVGHTPGAIALRFEEHLFTGDSLFPGGPGKTNSPEDFQSLMTDLVAKVFDRLPDETMVYPGHGADTTLGAERPALPDWWARGW